MERFELLGFVDLNELQNVFATELAKIDENIRINGGVPQNHRIIIEWIDNIRLSLISKARNNMQGYLQKHPEIRQGIRDERQAKETTEARKSWKDRVEKNRERARLGEE